jgi:aspartyl-tRNA(Asn)/glutamyl-tRNA(Gln) amidotransferase subunit A
MEIDLDTLTITTARDALRTGGMTAMSLAEACLNRIARLDPRLHAFITPTPELAIQAALAADALFSLRPGNLDDLPLLGIPVGLKDLFETAGIRTTGGSKFFNNPPAEDAEAVMRLKTAGAVILGKTQTHEIALGVTGVNPHFGTVRNPFDPQRIAGGSSSGSAAAVATGMCLAALGTDTGGSVRIPASLCGVVGLKPTRGRISTRGVIPLSWNLDHVGILARSAPDAVLLFDALAGYDPHDAASMDIPWERGKAIKDGVRGWRIALASGDYLDNSDARICDALRETGRVMHDLGAEVEKVEMFWLADLALANARMTQADAAAYHRDRLAAHPDWFGADVRQRLETGKALTSGEYILARQVQTGSRRRFDNFFSKYDLLVLPTTPVTAPCIDALDALETARQLTRFTSPFNLTGLPAISLPYQIGDSLPFGIQLVAASWQEAKLFQAGLALMADRRSMIGG